MGSYGNNLHNYWNIYCTPYGTVSKSIVIFSVAKVKPISFVGLQITRQLNVVLHVTDKETLSLLVCVCERGWGGGGLGTLILLYMLQPICEISQFMKWLNILAIS